MASPPWSKPHWRWSSGASTATTALPLAQFTQHYNSANRKTDDRCQRGCEHPCRTKMQNIGEQRGSGKQQRQQVQPERSMSVGRRILSQPELQEQRGKSDSSHYHQRQRAVKGRAAGVEHDQRQGQQQQSGGNDAPAALFQGRRGSGTLFRQGDRPKLYRDAAGLVIIDTAETSTSGRCGDVRVRDSASSNKHQPGSPAAAGS